MRQPKQSGRERRETEAARVQEKEGHGMVPNVTAGQAEGKAGELKEAAHQVEEEHGDWSKDH